MYRDAGYAFIDCNSPQYGKEAAECLWLRTLELFAQHRKREDQTRLGASLLVLRHMNQMTKTKSGSLRNG